MHIVDFLSNSESHLKTTGAQWRFLYYTDIFIQCKKRKKLMCDVFNRLVRDLTRLGRSTNSTKILGNAPLITS